jgi:erythromycin esterase
MLRLLILSFFLLNSFSISAQINEDSKFRNGDFECVGNNNQPLNWYVSPPLKYYTFSQDSTNPYRGKFSGRIKPLKNCNKKSSIVFYQRVIIQNIEDKILVNFRFKNNSDSPIIINYFIRPTSLNYDVDFTKFIDTTFVKIIGDSTNHNWFTYSVEMHFDKKVNTNDFFNIGIIAQDSIDFNIDDVEIYKDGKKFIEYPCALENMILPNSEDINWVQKNAIPIINTYDNINLKDISKIKKFFGNSSIIALGESTHGTKEFYTLRTRIIKYLIDSLDFQVVAFESGFENYNLANQLLDSANLPTRKIIDSLFTTNIYKTDQVVKLIDVIRIGNLSKTTKKTIISGFDEQGYYFQGALLAKDFKGIDSNMNKLINEINIRIRKNRTKQQDTIYNLSVNLYNRYKAIKNELINSHKELDFVLLDKRFSSLCNGLYLKYLYEKVKPYDTNITDYSVASTYRDSLMAENVIWLRKYYKNKKIIILCHNQHIQKNKVGPFEQTNQGYFLQKSLPKGEYKSFAFLTADGELTGYKKYPPEIVQVFKPYKSCYEYYFAKMKDSVFFLPLLQTKETHKHKNIISGLKMREAGYGISDGYDPFKEVDLLNGFDAVFFIKNTSATGSFLFKKGK